MAGGRPAGGGPIPTSISMSNTYEPFRFLRDMMRKGAGMDLSMRGSESKTSALSIQTNVGDSNNPF